MTTTSPLASYLDGDVLTERLQSLELPIEKAEACYIRHKPNESAIVGLRLQPSPALELPDWDVTWGYLRWFADVDRTETVHRKATTLRPRASVLGPGLTRVDAHALLYCFPNDARLRRLRWYLVPRKLKRSMEGLQTINGFASVPSGHFTSTVLRYKPERRLVAAIGLPGNETGQPDVVLRYTRNRRGRVLVERADRLGQSGVGVPRSLMCIDDGRVTVDEFVPGQQLRDYLQAPKPDIGIAEHLATKLALFHHSSLGHGRPATAGLSRRSPRDELARAAAGLQGLRIADSSLEPLVERIHCRLAENVPIDRPQFDVVLHGDLHSKNVMVDPAGDLTFVDLERMALGPAAVDLGLLLAHSIAGAVRHGLTVSSVPRHAVERYLAQVGRSGLHSGRSLGWHVAVGLVEQALLTSRYVEPLWSDKAGRLLNISQRFIGGQL